MDTNRFLKPAPVADGEPPRLIRDPASGIPLSAEGEWKSLTVTFWARRLAQKEVIDATPADEAAPAASAAHQTRKARPAHA